MIELTKEQHFALENDQQPVRALDPETQAEYVLLRADLYDQLKLIFSDGEGWASNVYPAAMKVFGPEGWDDPRMDVYDSLDPRKNP